MRTEVMAAVAVAMVGAALPARAVVLCQKKSGALFLRDAEQFFDAIESESVWDATLEAEPEPRPWLPEGRLD